MLEDEDTVNDTGDTDAVDTDTQVDEDVSDAGDTDTDLDSDDPETLKQKLTEAKKLIENKEKRRRDVQSWASKQQAEKQRVMSALEEAGLEFGEDGKVKRKQLDVGKNPSDFDEKSFLAKAKDDPAGAIAKLVKAEVAKTISAEKAAESQNSLRKQQISDKKMFDSLPGSEDVKDQIIDIIREEGLEFTKNPFSAAILLSGDAQLIEALKSKKQIGVRSREADKRAATVATGGGRTSESSIAGMKYEDLMGMSDDKIEKLVQAETRRQRGA